MGVYETATFGGPGLRCRRCNKSYEPGDVYDAVRSLLRTRPDALEMLWTMFDTARLVLLGNGVRLTETDKSLLDAGGRAVKEAAAEGNTKRVPGCFISSEFMIDK
jgi:hypothetical protein